MFRLAHFSDVHLGPIPQPRLRELASKRITGYANWRFNRRRSMGSSTLETLIADLREQAPDHVANTGDIINIGLQAEIDIARHWMETVADSSAMTFVPGNHDAYVHGTFESICRALGPWMLGDDAVSDPSFPFLRVREDVAIIGVSSTITTAPFIAAGRVTSSQIDAMKSLLSEAKRRHLLRVVLIHHPPVRGAAKQRKRLYGIGLFQKAVQEAGAELILHGHTHLPTTHWIAGPERPVPVVGISAAGHSPDAGGNRPPAAYNLFELSRKADDTPQIRRTMRGFAAGGTSVVQLKSEDLV